ncbi:hypothetical protein PMAYCL1PPCAC_00512, partial [Pristionchus mayeri]
NFSCIKTRDCKCSVCGKGATGTHYMSVSCNGCRSFFRRSIALKRVYECKRAGFSQLECFHRYRCKLCRLALCFAAGMSAEGELMTDNF